MKNVLITGASGFIGGFLVEEGLKRGFNVFAGIRRTSSREYLKDPRIRFVEFDFADRSKIVQTLEECKKTNFRFDFIIHNAGVTKAKKKEDFYNVNCRNTRNFIEALLQTNMVPEKFIFISSLAAYGPGNPVTDEPVKLSDQPKPIELYGKSKLEAEQYISNLTGFPWLIIRPTGVYGPKEKDYFVFFKTINRGLEPYIGFKKQTLTFIYVRDLVRLIFDTLATPYVRKAYFVTDGREYGSEEFATITKQVLGKKTLRLTVPLPIVKCIAITGEFITGLWGGVPTLNTDKYNVLRSTNWRCEVVPLQQDFGFKAEYDLEKGVQEAIEWYKKEHWL
ncbi:MAG: NAD(P)-dependent oxidoreductase [Bacteroidales bacterium]|jgi:nucleoside-diphosphate-sugar epimerase|nr:NAD(P)-dependent oxidoreductase [Bacteroidales bacterium]